MCVCVRVRVCVLSVSLHVRMGKRKIQAQHLHPALSPKPLCVMCVMQPHSFVNAGSRGRACAKHGVR